MKTIFRFPGVVLVSIVALGIGAFIAYAIPVFATSFGNDVAVTGSFDVVGDPFWIVNPKEFRIKNADTPSVFLHQTPGQFVEQKWEMSGNEAAFYVNDVTAGTIPFRISPKAPNFSVNIRETGNIGIGTLTPTHKLEVAGPVKITGQLTFSDATGDREINFDPLGPTHGPTIVRPKSENLDINAGPGGAIRFNVLTGSGNVEFYGPGNPGATLMTVKDSGNIGIGTLGPAEKFHVVGGSIMTEGTGGTGRVVLKGTGVGGHQYEWYPDSPAVGDLALFDRTALKNAIVFKANGNVGIGTAAPGQKLEVNGALRIVPMGAPASPSAGTIYFNASSRHFFGFDGTSWKQLDQ